VRAQHTCVCLTSSGTAVISLQQDVADQLK